MINNTTNLNFLVKVFKEDRTALILFSPSMNFKNARLIFEGMMKKLDKIYFGEELKDFNYVQKNLKFQTKEEK
jgi:hypothetical protein